MAAAESPNSPVSPLVSSPTESTYLAAASVSGVEDQQTHRPWLLSPSTASFQTVTRLSDDHERWVDALCRSPVETSEASSEFKSPASGTLVVLPLRNNSKCTRGSDSTITIRQPSPKPRNGTNSSIHKQLSRNPSSSPKPSKYNLLTTTNTSYQRANQVAFANVLKNLQSPLVPLVNVVTGIPHPEFPTSLLQFYLLTHEQLDSLSRWYHQVNPPVEETWCYPSWIPAWTSSNPDDDDTDVVGLETKRRRWGRFIGLRGCESPTDGPQSDVNDGMDALRARMERQWRDALRMAYEDQCLREKGYMGRS